MPLQKMLLVEKIKTKKIFTIEGNIGAVKSTMMQIIGKYFFSVEFVEKPVNLSLISIRNFQ